jgi:hypothetical protein
MPETFADLILRLRKDSDLLHTGEEAICQGAVLPILAQLGWNSYNTREVVPQFAVGNGRVDYCLTIDGSKAVFIEVKRANEELEKHQEQLLNYSFRAGVEIAVLTNGLIWWLYLPLLRGDWEERKFFAIDLQKQEPEATAKHFADFLSRQSIGDGSASKKARELQEGGKRVNLIKHKLPAAWQELCNEPDKQLVELLAERVERLCGHKPDSDCVGEFLAGVLQPPPPPEVPGVQRRKRQSQPGDYTFKRAVGYTFLGQHHTVSTWKEILIGVAQAIYKVYGREFAGKVQTLRGSKRPYFARDRAGMENPSQIPGTGIYVETKFSNKDTIALCHALMKLFGYSAKDLGVECEARR